MSTFGIFFATGGVGTVGKAKCTASVQAFGSGRSAAGMVVWYRYGKGDVHARRGDARPTAADGRARPEASEPGRSRSGQGLRGASRQAQRRGADAPSQALRHGRPGDPASTRRPRGRRAARHPRRTATGWTAARASGSVIHLDTSVLVDALTGPRRSSGALRKTIERGERLALSTLVLYEWRRGARLPEELAAQEPSAPAAARSPLCAATIRHCAGASPRSSAVVRYAAGWGL